ncbi:hypothetical protein TCAL_00386 [Tigriopus californicus]|uniref:non-specific serine/threonine protein kinase n=1 Tax=Tigriopus californicus TaxID=6832 RepID=A0A553NAS0_TIGCA|nr:hypothetical protein TCAL_00386 [Tigriopus californicus]
MEASEDTNDRRERQELEVEALRAVYDRDFQDVRSQDVWKVDRPPEFTLRLGPNHDSQGHLEEHCSLLLHVKMGVDYPHSAPAYLDLLQVRGLSDQMIEQLRSQLIAEAERLRGHEMILDLAQKVADWITQHNKPAFESIYAEMEARKSMERCQAKEAQDQALAERFTVESQELELIREEVARKAEAVKEERLQRKEEEKRKQQVLSHDESPAETRSNSHHGMMAGHRRPSVVRRTRTSSSRTSEGSDISVERSSIEVKQIAALLTGEKVTVTRGQLLGLNPQSGGSVFLGMCNTGRPVAVYEWHFRTQRSKPASSVSLSTPNPVHDLPTLTRQVAVIEQELSSMQKVPPHPNVVKVLGLTQEKLASTFKLYLFEEFVSGTSLSFYLNENIPLEADFLRFVVSGIVLALEHMHSQNVVHRDLRDTSVFLENGIVRVNGFSVERKARELTGHYLLDKFPIAIGRGGKKVDVFRLGLLVLSLALGEIVSDASIPTRLFSSDFCDFLKKCLNKNEHDRWSSAQLLDHPWIKQRIERTPLKTPLKQNALQARNETKKLNETLDSNSEQDQENEEGSVAFPFMNVGSGQSRLQLEFEFICYIGKGGFGEVMKVRNKLDGQIYAIKKIKLNPKNKQMTRKLMREVKLLSRLNHENVVRYYTSWIEVTTIMDDKKEVETSFDEDSSFAIRNAIHKSKRFKEPLNLDPNIHLPPGMTEANSSFGVSFGGSHFPEDDDSSSSAGDDESDDDDDLFGTSFLPQCETDWNESQNSSDSDIVFQSDSGPSSAKMIGLSDCSSSSTGEAKEPSGIVPNFSGTESSGLALSSVATLPPTKEIRLMYIQMEYCDKQTLRNAIDDGLHKDGQRMWRLFREIIEGLVHIHTQGMIHRDLKPVNIFLDAQDHVKIGDFGLATSSLMDKQGDDFTTYNDSVDNIGEDDMTGEIGTALYIAPEINAGRFTSYTQKVDIYSLGVIFFEMCHPPLTTGMERIQVLSQLRSSEIILPSILNEAVMMQQKHILQWMLDHDPIKRPNSQELLQSDFLPPPQVEEAELREMIKHSLANPKSSSYRHLIERCLSQNMDKAQDISFDMDLIRATSRKALRKSLLGQEHIRQLAQKVFHRHGAIHIQFSHMLPQTKEPLYDKATTLVQVMTRGGNVVSLPYDHRVLFARFLVRSQLSNVKRYCIGSVFREMRTFGIHPSEHVECAFDIVTPSEGCLLADAEVITVADELLGEVCPNRERGFFFRLNHSLLLRGILLNCGIEEVLHSEVYNVIREGDRWSKSQRLTHLTGLGISEQICTALFGVLAKEGPPKLVQNFLRYMIRKKTAASTDMKQALQELERIISTAQSMGVKCPMTHQTSMIQKKASLAQGLWIKGIKTLVCDSFFSLEEVQEQAQELGASHIVILRESESMARVRCLDKDRFQEKKVPLAEIPDFVEAAQDNANAVRDNYYPLNRCESISSSNRNGPAISESKLGAIQVNYNHIFLDKSKYGTSVKKKLESTISAKIIPNLQLLAPGVLVEVLTLPFPKVVVKSMAALLDFEDEAAFQRSFPALLEKHSRYRKELRNVCDEIQSLKYEKYISVFILYSVEEHDHVSVMAI